MNLLQYSKRLSKGCNEILLSEQITVMNILNGIFDESDIVSIDTSYDKPHFTIETASEDIANKMESKLNQQIIPGAYKPFYKIEINRNNNILLLNLIEI